MALSLALNHYIDLTEMDNIPTSTNLSIFSDSQAALNLMNDPLTPRTAQYLGSHLQELVQHITPQRTIKLFWTPGHKDIELNEQADEGAGEAAITEGEWFLLPSSLASTWQHVKTTFNSRGTDIDRDGYKTTGKEIAKASDNLEKDQAAAIFQSRSGHCPLNHFFARIQVVKADRCQHCGRKETMIHFLNYFPKYAKARQMFRNNLREAEIKPDTRRANLILDSPDIFPYLAEFITFTNRFEHFHTYLEK